MYEGTLKPLAVFFWGIAKLELFHFLIAALASTALANSVPNLKSFGERPFPLNAALTSDYDRQSHRYIFQCFFILIACPFDRLAQVCNPSDSSERGRHRAWPSRVSGRSGEDRDQEPHPML